MRSLSLTRPLCSVDVETTGQHPSVDRIVQIGVVKLLPDGTLREWSSLVNPELPIPPEITATHHITDEMVSNAKTFKELAPYVAKGFQGSDICAFSGRFDLAFLKAEFERARHPVPQWGRILDASDIFRRYNPRTLSAAVLHYLGEELNGAHDALVDCKATLRVLQRQVEVHEDLPLSVDELADLLETPKDGFVDAEGKLVLRHGKVCINFGKHVGQRIDSVDPWFLDWVIKSDFSPKVRAAARAELDRRNDERRRRET